LFKPRRGGARLGVIYCLLLCALPVPTLHFTITKTKQHFEFAAKRLTGVLVDLKSKTDTFSVASSCRSIWKIQPLFKTKKIWECTGTLRTNNLRSETERGHCENPESPFGDFFSTYRLRVISTLTQEFGNKTSRGPYLLFRKVGQKPKKVLGVSPDHSCTGTPRSPVK